MTAAQIMQQINRTAARRMALYRELAENEWLLGSQREALVKEVQQSERQITALYAELRAVRSQGLRISAQTKPERGAVIGRLRQGRLLPPAIVVGPRLRRRSAMGERRRAGLARLRRKMIA